MYTAPKLEARMLTKRCTVVVMLNQRQQDAIATLDWLFDESPDARRTGRTFVLAVSCIRRAARSPGSWVYVVDHYHTYDPASLLLDEVRRLVASDTYLIGSLETRRPAQFRLNIPELVENWVPVLARPESEPQPEPPTWHERLLDEVI